MHARFLVLSFFLVGLIFMPSVSRALTNDEILARINALLSQVQTLQGQLQRIEGGSVGPVQTTVGTVPTSTVARGTCFSGTQVLRYGDEGSAVTQLQTFLASDPSVYPDAIISGYYGSLTQAAVQRWQAKYGVVAQGTPATTGFGVVGPRTLSAMRAHCGSATTGSATTVTTNAAIARGLVITPEVGPVPLQVTATFSLNGSSCSSYYLDWGDGSAPLVFDAGNAAGCTKDIAHKRATHTYEVAGVHEVTLRAAHGPLSQAPVVGRTAVSVGSPAQSGLSLNPTKGVAPFTTSVTFPVASSNCTSYEVSWGDGNSDRHEPAQFVNCTQDVGTESLTHTYSRAGTYAVTFKSGNAPLRQLGVTGKWEVVVEEVRTNALTLAVTPTTGVAPLSVTVAFSGRNESCSSYHIDWGDGSPADVYEGESGDCGSFTVSKSFSHTYANPGTYTVRTLRVLNYVPLTVVPFNEQTIFVAGTPTTGPACSYPNTPVCGRVANTCPSGYVCADSYQTFANRCALETAKAEFWREGACN